MMQKIKAWLLGLGSNPMFQFFVGVAEKSAIGYLMACSFQFSKAWAYGLGSAVLGGLYHGFQVWLQQQTINTTNASGTSPKMALQKMSGKTVGVVLALGFAFAMVNPASAYEWNVPTKSLQSSKVKRLSSGLDQNAVVLIPTAALAVGTVSTSYGLSVSESLLWCHVKGLDAATSQLTSYFGVGASAYGDFGDWLSSNFVTSPRLKCGVGIILPAMCGITPGVMEVWDVRNGGKATVVTMNVPLNLLNSLITKL